MSCHDYFHVDSAIVSLPLVSYGLTIAECIGARVPANATTQSACNEAKEADFREKQGAYQCTRKQLLALATASILVVLY